MVKEPRAWVLLLCGLFAMGACSAPKQEARGAPLPLFEYLGAWGTAGTAPGQLHNPRAIASDSLGNVFIADARKPTEIEKFGTGGEPRLAFASRASENPWDIAIDPGNAIFLLDLRRKYLQIYSPEGIRFRTLPLRYRRFFKYPSSIAIDAEGEFYLADFGTGRILKMNARGRILRVWGKPEGIQAKRWEPCRVRLGPEGSLYVADAENQQVDKLTQEARLVTAWDFPFSDLQASRNVPKAYGLAVSQKFVAASDEGKHLLEIWNRDGTPVDTVDFSQHLAWGRKAAPTDVAFTPEGELLVLDGPDARVLRFRINWPAATGAQNGK